MSDTIELCMAGQMVVLPAGISITLPYMPWSPRDVEEMYEDDRQAVLEVLRNHREAILKHLK